MYGLMDYDGLMSIAHPVFHVAYDAKRSYDLPCCLRIRLIAIMRSQHMSHILRKPHIGYFFLRVLASRKSHFSAHIFFLHFYLKRSVKYLSRRIADKRGRQIIIMFIICRISAVHTCVCRKHAAYFSAYFDKFPHFCIRRMRAYFGKKPLKSGILSCHENIDQ